MNRLLCIAFLVLAAGCVPKDHYVHDTATQDAQRQAAIHEANTNAQRTAQQNAAMMQMLTHYQTQVQNNRQGNPGTRQANPGTMPWNPGATANAAPNQQNPFVFPTNQQITPEIKLLTDFVNACQTEDYQKANSLMADAAGRFAKTPEQKALVEQMNQILELQGAISNPDRLGTEQQDRSGTQQGGGFGLPGRNQGLVNQGGKQGSKAAGQGGFRPPVRTTGQTIQGGKQGGGFRLPQKGLRGQPHMGVTELAGPRIQPVVSEPDKGTRH